MQAEPTFPQRHPVWTTVLTLAAVVLVGAIASCGSANDQKPTKTVTVTKTVASPTSSTSSGGTRAIASSDGASRPARKRHAKLPPGQVMCDANIRVKRATTTCRFAENVFVAYWAHENYPGSGAITAYSPKAGRNFQVACARGASRVTCTTSDDAEIGFSHAAVARYSLSQAKAYVAASDVGDVTFPWEKPDSPGGSDNVTPSYTTPDATPSVPDTSPTPPGQNIPNYDNGRGYRVQCADGTYSHSGGIRGACSHHGGVG
jgi:hypothetical protein